MATLLRPLLLTLFLLGIATWSGTDAFSLLDLFGDTTGSPTPTEQTPLPPERAHQHNHSHTHHHHGHHTTKNHHAQHNHNPHGDDDDNRTNHNHHSHHKHHHGQKHDQSHAQAHDQPIEGRQEPSVASHSILGYKFDKPLSLDERRQQNEWSGTNKKLRKHHHGHHDRHNSDHGYINPYYNQISPYHTSPDQHMNPYLDHNSPHNTPHHQRGSHKYYSRTSPTHPGHKHSAHHHHAHSLSPLSPYLHYPPPPPAPVMPSSKTRRMPSPLANLLPPPPPPLPPSAKCPMLYSRVGHRCVAIFSVARMTWRDAQHFCDGIFGDLITFTDYDFKYMVNFLKEKGLSSPLWVGGHATPLGWLWISQQRHMTLGTPFWAVRTKDSTNSINVQAPTANLAEYDQWCAAMDPEDFYYLSDAKCEEKRAPVCELRRGIEVMVARPGTNYYPALEDRAWMKMGRCSGEEAKEEGMEEANEEDSSSSSSSSESNSESSEDEEVEEEKEQEGEDGKEEEIKKEESEEEEEKEEEGDEGIKQEGNSYFLPEDHDAVLSLFIE
ncbi:uncharacterized protein LOC123514124 [Portunus trituberculatus]|uniref:uncharacterized protein LOC123514124 n=1 Tax=Portunus trituberculatus TaxID=210409 RepID=UPI001E1CF137|nr:uncharacterized protein LOC123514124 [Portunus trituberculatus]